MTADDGRGAGDFEYPEDDCIPACPLCGFQDRHLAGESCPHFAGLLVQEDDVAVGPEVESFPALWHAAYEALEGADDTLGDRLNDPQLGRIYEALIEDDRYWWIGEFPYSVRAPDPVAPGHFIGWAVFDPEPRRFQGVLDRLEQFVRAASRADSGNADR